MTELRYKVPESVEAEPGPVTQPGNANRPFLGQAREARPASLWKDALKRFFKHKLAVAGLVILLMLCIPVIGAELFQRYDPTLSYYDRSKPLYTQNFQPPSAEHWFGTDGQNRDLWARMLHGGRNSLMVGVVVQLIVLALGLPLGLLAGYLGGRVDGILSFIINIFYAFPALLAGLLLLSVFGGNTVWVFIAIGIGLWPRMARLVRSQVFSLREKEFVEAAQAIGAKPSRIMFRHILPNTLGPVIVSVSFGIPMAIQIEAFYGFIGISVPPPATSWGQLVFDGFQAFQTNPPTIVIIPGLAIALTCVAFNFIGDGLRDALDPRNTGR
jgi:oligopeptide transport system permease protein